MADETNETDKTKIARENANEKRFIDPSTGAPDGASDSGSSSPTGAGSKTDKSQRADPVDTGNRVREGQSQGNLGGRNPDQARKAMGDRDSTQNRNDMDMVDPMSGRLPDQLDKVHQQKPDAKAQRDP